MIARIGKTYSFDAAHRLPNHDGKCAQPHGHTYALTVEVEGHVRTTPGASDEGMVLDYGVLDGLWNDDLKPLLDHRDLNDTIGKRGCWPTTAENIAAWVYAFLEPLIPEGARLHAVQVSETPKTFARVERQPANPGVESRMTMSLSTSPPPGGPIRIEPERTGALA